MKETFPKLSAIRRLFKLLSVDKRSISNIYIYAIFSGIINLSLPLGIQAIINLINGGEISSSWAVLVGLVISGMILVGILQIFQLTIIENIQQKIFTRSAFEFAYRLPRMRSASTREYYVPELVNRFFDTLTIQKGLPKLLVDFSSAVLQVVFGLILLSFYHPFFIFFSLVLVVLVFLILFVTGPKGMKTSLKESKYKYEVAYWLEEVARTLETFKLAGKTDLPLQKTDKLVVGYLKSRRSHFQILLAQYISMVTLKAVVAAGLLILGAILVMEQQMNIGQFVAAEIVIILVLASVEKIILSMETIFDVLTAVEKIGAVTDVPLENSNGNGIKNITQKDGLDIKLNNLSYRFETLERDILKNVNLTINAGEKICISGVSGSGKSLLLQIIAGLYSDYRGALSYNQIPLGNLDANELHYIIGDILAKEDIFRGTIMENISIGRASVDLDNVREVTQIVGLTDFIENTSEGYNTMLYPAGMRLPKTVSQKIMLARCIAGHPKLVLLEDTFSTLAAEDKERLMAYLLDKSNPCTVVAVSNDPLVMKQFDRIIHLDMGKIVEE